MPLAPVSIPHIAFAIDNARPHALDLANTHFVPARPASAAHSGPHADPLAPSAADLGPALRAYYQLDATTGRAAPPRDVFGGTLGTTGALMALTIAFSGAVAVESNGFEPLRQIPPHLGRAVVRFDRDAPPASIADALPDHVDQLWWTNPHNPTGERTPAAHLATLAEALAAKNVLLVVNEIYHDYAAEPATSCLRAHANIAVVSSLTKVYARGDLRVGWVAGPADVVAAVRSTRFVTTGPPPSASLGAAAAVIAECGAGREPMRAELNARWKDLCERLDSLTSAGALREVEGPFGLFQLAPNGTPLADDVAIARWLRERFNLLVAPGTFLDAPGHLRLSVAAAGPRFDEALHALYEGLKRVRRNRYAPPS